MSDHPRLHIIQSSSNITPEILLQVDPSFKRVLEEVGPLDFTQLTKKPYVALLGAIIGQKIRFTEARNLRSQLYATFGNDFTFSDVYGSIKWSQLRLPGDKVTIIEALNSYLSRVDDVNTFLVLKLILNLSVLM